MPLLTLNELEKIIPSFQGRYGNALCRGLMRILSIDKVNDLYDSNSVLKGPDFATAVLKDIGVEYELMNPEVLSRLPKGPFIIICNHPYGHIDGLMLVDLFGHIRPDCKVMVNSFLGRIKSLDENFICVSPTGVERTSPTKDSIKGVKKAIAHIRSGGVLGLFPSGAVSDLNLKDRCVRDRQWQEPVIRLIWKMNLPIVPVHFIDGNSRFYYLLGLISWKIRLLRLPAEVFNKRYKPTRLAIGEIITPDQLSSYSDIKQLSDFLRHKVYNQF